jgi:hypothetical protein
VVIGRIVGRIGDNPTGRDPIEVHLDKISVMIRIGVGIDIICRHIPTPLVENMANMTASGTWFKNLFFLNICP